MSQPTNDPHPTARALVEAWMDRCAITASDNHGEVFTSDVDDLAVGITIALTAARDAGRREGREEMRECLRAVREIASQHPLPDTPAYLSMPWLQVVRLIDKALA